MDDQVVLYNSTLCRLCAEENENGILLFGSEEYGQELCDSVNRYLPLKIKDDGKLPRTICPGCNIQLAAMIQFIDLIITGQEKLRELWRVQQELLRRKDKIQTQLENTVLTGSPDLEFFIQIMPDGSIYTPNHELALKIEGLEKPRRKRGRPPKPPPNTEVVDENNKPEEEFEPEEDFEDDPDGRKRRRRKIPERFRESVQGKDLERIFREEGVIDEEECVEQDGKDDKNDTVVQENQEEIIGHLENKDGQDLGELVIVNKGKFSRGHCRRKKKYTCEICNRAFLHYGRYLIHKNFHKGVKFECTTCKDLFNSKEELTKHHIDTNHTGEGIVESLTDTQSEKLEEKETNDSSVSSENKYSCEQCNKTFMSKQSYEVHVKAIHEGQKPFHCDLCNKSFAYQTSLKGHMSSHEQKSEKGYPCDICSKIFNHPSSVVYHKESEHNNGRRFVCNKCGKSFKHKQLLQRHQLVHSEDRPFVCKLCGASFKAKSNLLNHQLTHNGIKKYYCQQCGHLFAHKTSLNLHYRWHSGQKPYECNVCQKTFSQKGNLREHKRIHTGEKPYSCEICGRSFTTSSQFKLHLKRHTGERPWSCEYCNKSFLHKDTWKCHIRRHRNERPFQCNICLRDFTEQWALKKHQRIHTGEKSYICNICNKAFADCSNLNKHKKIHKNNNEVQVIATDAGNVLYVSYDDNDSTEMPTLVQFLNESNVSQLENSESLSQSEPSMESSLIPSSESPTELSLEDYEDNTDLQLSTDQIHVTDEDGNPIYFTGQDGQKIRVTSYNGENLQVCLEDGTILPIQLNAENSKPIAVQLTDQSLKPKQLQLDQISLSQLAEKSNGNLNTDINNLMDQSVHFMTEDGQNICLVTTYNMDSDYLPVTIT